MKHSIILLILFLSCKAQDNRFSKVHSNELPAYQIEKIKEKSVIMSTINSSNFEHFQKVIFNKKEYSIKEVKNILDTIGKNYTFYIKFDSISNKKLLIIKKQP
jgi:hypothetical protein